MDASQSLLIVVAVENNVIGVLGSEFFHHLVDVFHATVAFTHSLCGEVCVAARTIPVLEELGGEGNRHVEVLSYALKNIARHPEVVSHGNSLDGANLVFPLAGHDFGVGA